MNMQLLYGNDGMNYRTIAKSKQMTDEQEKKLLDGYVRYSFVKDEAKYASVYEEPVALTYVTTDLEGTLPKEMILLSRNAKMSNYHAPSYYSHMQLLELSDAMYGEKFFDLLRYSFIKDVDVNSYIDNRDIDTDRWESEEGAGTIRKDAIDEDKLFVIVALLLEATNSMSGVVRLALDVEGAEYNQRALEVIAAIYSRLPYYVRRKAGFSTYAGVGEQVPSRIKLQLYTRDALDEPGKDVIDLAHMDNGGLLSAISNDSIKGATGLISMDAQKRKETFWWIQNIYGWKVENIGDALDFYEKFVTWMNSKLEEIKDGLAHFAYSEMKKREKSPEFKKIFIVISKKFQDENCVERYNGWLKEMLSTQTSFNFELKLREYIMLGEALEILQFDPQMFLDWEKETILQDAEQNYEDIELRKYLEGQLRVLHSVDIGGKKFHVVIRSMKKALTDRLDGLKDAIEKYIEEERKAISDCFSGRNFIELNELDMDSLYQNIKYKNENASFFIQEFTNRFFDILKAINKFDNYYLYKDYVEFLVKNGKYLNEKNFQSFVESIEEKGDVAKFVNENQNLEWMKARDIFSVYGIMSVMMFYEENYGIEIPEFCLKIGDRDYFLNIEEMLILVENILNYDYEYRNMLEEILCSRTDMVKELLSIYAFSDEHFDFLMAISNEEEKENVMKYYLRKENVISGKSVIKHLENMDKNVLISLKNNFFYKDNIFSQTIEKLLEKEEISGEKTEEKRKNWISQIRDRIIKFFLYRK